MSDSFCRVWSDPLLGTWIHVIYLTSLLDDSAEELYRVLWGEVVNVLEAGRLLSFLKESLHWRWLSWDNQVVHIRHDYEVDITCWIASWESAWIWSHLWKMHPFENLSQINLPWSRWISETIQLTFETPHSSLETESPLAPKWVLLIHLQENWETLAPHLTQLDSICEADSPSKWCWDSCLRCVGRLRFLVYDLREALATETSMRTPERGPMTQQDAMNLAWSSWERGLSGFGSYNSWPELLREMSPSWLMAFLISFSE